MTSTQNSAQTTAGAAAEMPEGTGTGTPFRRIRMDDDLWDRLDEAVKRADPDSNRSALLRKFARWFVGDVDELPRRPEPPQRQDQGDGKLP